ncbi:DJ-1/PfpI family protein [Cupriavidus basilensis]
MFGHDFFLAAAGLLDGRRATTHWGVAALLRQRFPAVEGVDADAIFVRQGNLWTSAGVTAGIDLALAVVEEDLGRELAPDLARELVSRPRGVLRGTIAVQPASGQRRAQPRRHSATGCRTGYSRI